MEEWRPHRKKAKKCVLKVGKVFSSPEQGRLKETSRIKRKKKLICPKENSSEKKSECRWKSFSGILLDLEGSQLSCVHPPRTERVPDPKREEDQGRVRCGSTTTTTTTREDQQQEEAAENSLVVKILRAPPNSRKKKNVGDDGGRESGRRVASKIF